MSIPRSIRLEPTMGYVASNPSDLQASFYEAAANPAIWSDTLERFSSTFRSRGCLLTTANFMPGGIPHSHGMRDVLDQFFRENWHTRDLRTDLGRSKRITNGFFCDQDILSSEDMEKSDYYHGFARNAGVPWFSAAVLTERFEDDFIAISLQRSASDGAFSKSELASMNVLLPQLRNATEVARRLADLRGKSIVDGLALACEPAMLLDRKGKVLFANSCAQDLLGSTLNLVAGKVTSTTTLVSAALATLIDKACSMLAADAPALELKPVILRSRAGAAEAIVRAAPVRRSGGDVFGFEGVVLIVSTLRPREQPDTALFKDAYGLTSREAEVLGLIAVQPKLEAVADKLGISREAVRFHLKSIFLKTDKHKQSELIALLWRFNAGAGTKC
jgi:DNA-binding CsgD family transcriptional regulator